MTTPDPFDTESLRAATLAAWRTSVLRFREDANAEDELARSAYADRAFIELAQNAADAGGGAGSLRIELHGNRLYAANSGRPLDAAGVAALSHLRTSTKDAASVGRFGVGFKAVLALTDAPEVHTTTGGVRWSAEDTRAVVREISGVVDEIDRRGGQLPVMRLPWVAPPDPHVDDLLRRGAATVVVLPLLDVDRAVELLDALDARVLLGLPGLHEVELPGGRVLSAERSDRVVVLRDGAETSTWWLAEATGDLPAELLADRPVEERARTRWSATWAFGFDGTDVHPVAPASLLAPTMTDDRLSVPAVLSLTVPLDSSRRHVVDGPLAQHLLQRAAHGYAAALAQAPGGGALLDLVPLGFPASQVDGLLRAELEDALARSRFLPTSVGGRVAAPDAVALDVGAATDAVTRALSGLVPGLVHPDCNRRHGALAALGVRRLATADVVDLLADVDQSPEWWAELYAALSSAPDPEALRALPVPTSDGGLVRDVARIALPSPELAVDAVDALERLDLPVRWAHPAVASGPAREVLLRAGARVADPGHLLDLLRDAVEESLDDEPPIDRETLADAVLALVASDPGAARDRAWLGSLALPTSDGGWQAAEELLLPEAHGGRLVTLVRADAPFGVVSPDLVARAGTDAILMLGVLAGFGVVRDDDVTAEDEGHFLDGEEDWFASLPSEDGRPPVVAELVAVRDLEWVRDDAWPAALDAIGSDQRLRDALQPVSVAGRRAPSYTAWWLANHATVPDENGVARRPGELSTADVAPDLAAVFDRAGPLSPSALLVASRAGLVDGSDLDGALAGDVLRRLADPGREVTAAQAVRLYAAALTAARATDVDGVRVFTGTGTRVSGVRDAVAVDAPWVTGLVDPTRVLACRMQDAAQAAYVLGVPLGSDLVEVDLAEGVERAWADLDVTELLDALDGSPESPSYVVHDALPTAWLHHAGMTHLRGDASTSQVAEALAWAAGIWPSRDLVARWLAGDDRAALLRAALLG